MLTPAQALNARQLMEEAAGLAEDVRAHQGELLSSGLDALGFITAQQAASHSIGALDKFGHVLASNRELSGRMMRLSNMAQGILHDCDDSNYAPQIRQAMDEINEMDLTKIEDEDLLREFERRRDNVLASARVTSVCAASAEIPIFFLAFSHSDLAQAYVNKPPLSRRALNNASQLIGAAAMDVAGTVIPFLGTAFAVFQLMDPWIEREKQRMVEAMPQIDRLFNLDEDLTTLAEFSALVEGSTSRLVEFLSAYRKSFADDVRWLTKMARNERRS
jgi:hypothetical protein